MDFRTILQERLSKQETEHLAGEIGSDPEQFDQLWKLSMEKDETVSPRAAWLIDHLLGLHPELLLPHLAEAVRALGETDHHNSIHRNLCKSLLLIEVPEELQGTLYDTCIDHLLSPASAIAIKAHCMELAARIALPYPELKEELRTVIQDLMIEGSAGIIARGKKMLKFIA